MLKGIPIILSADFSPEFPQARKDWDDIYKVIQGENIQPRIFYPARLSFRFKGESKTFTDKQTLRIQHYQTSFTTNAKGTSLGREHKRRKRLTENKTTKTMVIGSCILISTLNVNRLNAPTKDHRLAG